MSNLVIVESPAKIKKIKQYLGEGFDVDSCVGHIRDLPATKADTPKAIKDKPWAEYAVDIDNDFRPYYVTIKGKEKVIRNLKAKLKQADTLYLATDEDREGESISWHLVEALKPDIPVKRMVFNEITKKAVNEAVNNPRDLDLDLVQAQETRRILDRLYGYALSPLLWKKVGGNLSAGRVQSVAVRFIVERERARRAFKSASYWDLVARLEHLAPFEATLTALDGTRIASGRDFGDDGQIEAGRDVVVVDEARARELEGRLKDEAWTVASVEQEEKQTRPKPPFITSTLQQEANNRLNLGAAQSMRIAQRLYENGLITYMRTDSVALSQEAIDGARGAIKKHYGEQYLPSAPRHYTKKEKGAQEAHEAIRPAGEEFVDPDKAGLSGQEKALYRLIWERTLACQMPNEQYTQTTAQIDVAEARFTANGKVVTFPGYRIVYPAQSSDTQELPALAEGDRPVCNGLTAEGHETKPPARFTEATLVRELEKQGIGRPSTYASILDTIIRRGYVIPRGKSMVPSFTAFAVVGLLEKHFPELIDPAFTAKMESVLDDIAAGQAEWVPFLGDFFLGPDGLQAQIAARHETIDPEQARRIDIADFPHIVRIGRFGPYVELERQGEKVTVSVPDGVTPDELDAEMLERMAAARQEGPPSLGDHPDTGEPIYVMEGRFGPYYQLGDGDKPKRASLPKGKSVDEADLDEAVFLLSLPRTLGDHPDGGEVQVNLGRYGPYVAHIKPEGKPEYRSLPDVGALETTTLEEGLGLLAQPKGRGRGQTVLKDLGPHPDDGKPVQLLAGRYGPYVKHDKTNASLPKGQDPEGVSMEEAVQLLAKRKARKK